MRIRAINSAVECLLYTEGVGGSNPSSSISIIHTMNKEKIKTDLHEIHLELAYIRAKMDHVSYQMQELRDAIRESSNKTEELSMPELYEHPWYKYKREELVAGGNYIGDTSKESQVSIDL